MTWESFEKRQQGPNRYGLAWASIPAIAITKSGLTMNPVFLERYAAGSSQCYVMKDESNGHRRIGIKIVPRGDEAPEAFNMRQASTASKARVVHCKGIVEAFADLQGLAFRAMHDPAGKLVIVELSPENRIK